MSNSSDPGQIAEDFLNAYNAKLSAVAPSAVVSQCLLMGGISLGTILLFNVLRPRNRIIYEPKCKYYIGDKRPPKITNGFFDWVRPLATTTENDLMNLVGLDAVAYLRFLRMLRWLFSIIAVLTCAVLIPVNVTYTEAHTKSYNTLGMLTIGGVSGNILYVHVGITYVITFVILGFVWYNWRKMVALRYKFFRSPEYTASFYARTLMIQNVPPKYQSDDGLQALFQSLHAPYPTTAVHIGRRVGNLPELIEYHNQTVRELEHVLVRYLKDGKVGKKRPMIRVGGKMGLGGQKVDAIDYYTDKVKKLENAVENWRAKIDLRQPEDYGFASMAAVPFAHIVARMLFNKRQQGASISLAPNPKDIIWKNLTITDSTRYRLQVTGTLILVVVCFFNTIPLLAISALANLAALSQYVQFLSDWQSQSNLTFSIVSGVLPPAISGLFGYFLPILMRRVIKYQGSITRSRADADVIARYYAFLVISQFFIFSLLGVAFEAISTVVQDVQAGDNAATVLNALSSQLPGQIQTTYVMQSNYWLTWYPLRGFLVFFDLAQLINLMTTSIRTHLFGRTPRDIRDWTKPPSFDYAVYYSSMLFMATVALLYAPLAPLVPLMGAVVFWASSFIYKYQLLFVFITKVETGGRLWNVVINRLLMGTVFMHLLMALTMWLGAGDFAAISMIPPIIIVLGFKFYTFRVFNRPFMFYIPDEEEIATSRIHSQRADVVQGRLEKRFGHPGLYAELFTPMVHANMAHLLPEVYHGRLSYGQAKIAEYGGQKMEAQVAGGITIASVGQRDLEYDPALYQRDRGEENWDARSIGSATLLSDAGQSPSVDKGELDHKGQKMPGYEQYMQYGPGQVHYDHLAASSVASLGTPEEVELARLEYNVDDQRPLLYRTATQESFGRPSSPIVYPPPPSNMRTTSPLVYPPPPGNMRPLGRRAATTPSPPDFSRSSSYGPDAEGAPSYPSRAGTMPLQPLQSRQPPSGPMPMPVRQPTSGPMPPQARHPTGGPMPVRQPTSDPNNRNAGGGGGGNMAGRGTFNANRGLYGPGPDF